MIGFHTCARSRLSAMNSCCASGTSSSAKIASTGHSGTHSVQSMHSSGSVTPVLVDYWAEWCGPCKSIAPMLDEVAKEYVGRLKIAKINVDENQSVPAKFGIRGIPTLMLFENGNVEATRVGALSKSQLTAFLDSNI